MDEEIEDEAERGQPDDDCPNKAEAGIAHSIFCCHVLGLVVENWSIAPWKYAEQTV